MIIRVYVFWNGKGNDTWSTCDCRLWSVLHTLGVKFQNVCTPYHNFSAFICLYRVIRCILMKYQKFKVQQYAMKMCNNSAVFYLERLHAGEPPDDGRIAFSVQAPPSVRWLQFRFANAAAILTRNFATPPRHADVIFTRIENKTKLKSLCFLREMSSCLFFHEESSQSTHRKMWIVNTPVSQRQCRRIWSMLRPQILWPIKQVTEGGPKG